MAEPLYSLNDIYYCYPGGIEALNGVTLRIGAGQRTAIIGANGTGKSTLLALLDGLIFPQRGSLHFDGQALTPRSMIDASFQLQFRKRVGYVFQNPDIQLFCPSVRDDILFGPLQLGVPMDEIERRFDAVVDRIRLRPLLDRSPHQLSIGEKKKVAIAGVLVIEPEVLLLDEPTAGLDPRTTRDVISILADAHRSGRTVVMATHDLHVVEEIADVVHVMGENRTVIRSGGPEEILADQSFLQRHNLEHIHVHRHLHTHHLHPH